TKELRCEYRSGLASERRPGAGALCQNGGTWADGLDRKRGVQTLELFPLPLRFLPVVVEGEEVCILTFRGKADWPRSTIAVGAGVAEYDLSKDDRKQLQKAR